MQRLGELQFTDHFRSIECKLTWGVLDYQNRPLPMIRASIKCNLDHRNSVSSLHVHHDIYRTEGYLKGLTTELSQCFQNVERIAQVGDSSERFAVADGIGLFNLAVEYISRNGADVILALSAAEDDTPWDATFYFQLSTAEIRNVTSELRRITAILNGDKQDIKNGRAKE